MRSRCWKTNRAQKLYVGGRFDGAETRQFHNFALWNGSTWYTFDAGLTEGSYLGVRASTVSNTDDGPTLYAGGSFALADDLPASNFACRELQNVECHASPLGPGGSGPAVCAGGHFSASGQATLSRIGKWT